MISKLFIWDFTSSCIRSFHHRRGKSWWSHQMETFSALLAICAGNSPVPGEFPTQRPVARSFDVFFDLRLNKRFSKQSWGWWFETLSHPLWRHCNVMRCCHNTSWLTASLDEIFTWYQSLQQCIYGHWWHRNISRTCILSIIVASLCSFHW